MLLYSVIFHSLVLLLPIVSAFDVQDENADISKIVDRFPSQSLQKSCPNMIRNVFEQSAPRDEEKAGVFEEYKLDGDLPDLRACVIACCEKKNATCNAVFIFKKKCYHVKCHTNEGCLPKERPEVKVRLQMVLVNPIPDGAVSNSWISILKAEKMGEFFPEVEERLNFWKQPRKFRLPDEAVGIPYDEEEPTTEKRIKEILMDRKLGNLYGSEQFAPDDSQGDDEMAFFDAGAAKFNPCKMGAPNMCPRNEECAPISPKTREGICKCRDGYQRNALTECVKGSDMDYSGDSIIEKYADPETDKSVTMDGANTKSKNLTVSVISKNVRLPEKEAFLAAYTAPDEKSSGDTYKYVWTLISQPKSSMNGTISDQNKSKVKLSNLSEGLYSFKVTVTGNGSYGEAFANVTVLPEKRINKPPEVIITPKEQTIKLPNTQAILDGSTSVDDDKIVKWHWDLTSGPLGYQEKLPETSTLQLGDLRLPGNYTFKLTVTDSDNAENSTTASLTVLSPPDYAPEANAGTDEILYLPHNNITLNGTLSKDDHEIVAWEWTKDDTVQGKAVDMQNTRTPFLQLSNLEEGIYTFVLKVTDASNQSSTAKVHVFVKPPTNLPPVANANGNFTISLPKNWAKLDGSQSTDDIGITKFFWKQIAGPNMAVIENSNASIANATSLTVGVYKFELTVADENENVASDCVWVTVVQEKNSPPVANAGGDQTITLPVSAIYLNGSKSSDDLAIVNWTWTRDGTSLASGNVVGSSDREPVMILTNPVPGRYVFKLTVSDDQGLSSSDTVSIIVHPDPILLNLVELTLSMGISTLTQSELESLEQKIVLLLGAVKVHIRALKIDPKSEEAILVFYVEKESSPDAKTSIVSGLEVERILKDKLWRDASILGTSFTDVRTSICQNQCSNHGVCNTVTRACICETFWMPSVFYYWSLEEANCDWSILYVIVGGLVCFLLLSGIFWALTCACRKTKKSRVRPKVQKYALLGTQEDELPSFTRSTCITDSETDSDVLFENQPKQNGILRNGGSAVPRGHGHGPKYGSTKPNGRRVRT